jgi:Zn-dependent peptidase ImmA (M78 family)
VTSEDKADDLKLQLKALGLSDSVIDAAWPRWWSNEADHSVSARVELRFSLARKLGLDPLSLIDEGHQPRFVWKDEARFKHLSGEGELELSAITSFGKAVGALLISGAPSTISLAGATAKEIRTTLLHAKRPYVSLADLLSLCWSVGIPVIHLRIFPWPQKRMAAMTVRVGDRSVILLGKDSNYPPHIAFYLAHEIGHIVLAHLSEDVAIVDLEPLGTGSLDDDAEEGSADRFALELLTGNPDPIVLPVMRRYSARELARVALSASVPLKVEPGTLALCFGYSTKDWATANASMPRIYKEGKPAWLEVNKIARAQLEFDRIPNDSQDFLSAILGFLST